MRVIVWIDTKDPYELPLYVADSVREMSRKCGMTEDSIYSSRSHAKQRGHKQHFLFLDIEEEQ